MTVKELMKELQKLAEQGYEDTVVTVDDMNCGEEVNDVYVYADEVVLTF